MAKEQNRTERYVWTDTGSLKMICNDLFLVVTATTSIIAVDFSAVPTDSPLQMEAAQQLAAASQQFKEI